MIKRKMYRTTELGFVVVEDFEIKTRKLSFPGEFSNNEEAKDYLVNLYGTGVILLTKVVFEDIALVSYDKFGNELYERFAEQNLLLSEFVNI